MASLNTLRTKGGLIISIVIGVALLAFLLGDLTSSQSIFAGRRNRVGEINGTSIGYVEYSNRIDALTAVFQTMWGRDAFSTEEQLEIRDMAWQSLILENAVRPGFEKLGISPSESEKRDMMLDVYISPVVSSFFTDPITGTYSAASLREFLRQKDMDATGRYQLLWEYIQEQADDERALAKMGSLVSNAVFVTSLEVKSATALSNETYGVDVVSENYSAIADDLVNVSTNDLKAYYDAHKQSFNRVAQRDIEYVIFDMLPSAADYADAEKDIDQIAAEFALSDMPMQYATLNSQEAIDSRYYSESQLDPAIALAVFDSAGAMYGPVLAADVYTLARQAEVRMMPDTLEARHIVLSATETAKADSLINAIRGGEDFGIIAMTNSYDSQTAQMGGQMGRFTPNDISGVPQLMDAMVDARVGNIQSVVAGQWLYIFEVTYKSPLVRKAQIATIKYHVLPSAATDQTVYAAASNFMSSATGSYDNFRKAVSESGVSQRVARVSSTDRNVSGLSDSRELIRWAFNGKQGAVSDIMQIDNDYVIAALVGVQEEGIPSMEDIRTEIMPLVMAEKKAEYLKTQVGQVGSLSAVASGLGKEIISATGVTFDSYYIENVSMDTKLIGAIGAGIPLGQLSRPVAGASALHYFQITSRETVENTDEQTMKIILEATSANYVTERASQAMTEESDIKDWRVKFF